MISLKDYECMSYRQLQAVAKNAKVPANLKKSYLIELLTARSRNDENHVRRIIQQAHYERAHSKERQDYRPNSNQDEDLYRGKNIVSARCPNTELEKLLKAPISSSLDDLEVNYRRGQLDDFIGQEKNSEISRSSRSSRISCCTKKSDRKRKVSISQGRQRPSAIDTFSVDSLSSYEYESEDNYFDELKSDVNCNDFQNMQVDNSAPTKSKIRKLFDPQMRMVDPMNQTPRSDDTSSSEFLNVDSWTNYEGSNNDENAIVDVKGDFAHNDDPTYTEFSNNDARKDSSETNVTLSEYDRTFEKEHAYSYWQKQKIKSSEPTTLNMQDFYQKPHEGLFVKDNVIVINQHFQIYSSIAPESRNIVNGNQFNETLMNGRDYDPNEGTSNGINAYNDNNTNINNTINEANEVYSDYPEVNANRQENTAYKALLPSGQSNVINLNSAMYQTKESMPFLGPAIDMKSSNDFLKLAVNKGNSDVENINLVGREDVNLFNGKQGNEIVPSHTAPLNAYANYQSTSNTSDYELPYLCNKNKSAFQAQQKRNEDLFREFMSLDLRCDINEEISTTLQQFFESLDLRSRHENIAILSSDDVPVSSEEEVYTSQVSDISTSHSKGQWEFPYTPMNGSATSMLCFLCDWLGEVSEFSNHVKKCHSRDIFKAQDGMLTVAINVGMLRKNPNGQQKQFFVEHAENLYIVHVKYKYPDILLPILLSIPPNGRNTTENMPSKFYFQVINLFKEQEIIWTGTIECMNKPGRPLDTDVYSNRKHGRFEISMRSLDLVPNDVPLESISQYLEGCAVEIHLFIETLHDSQIYDIDS